MDKNILDLLNALLGRCRVDSDRAFDYILFLESEIGRSTDPLGNSRSDSSLIKRRAKSANLMLLVFYIAYWKWHEMTKQYTGAEVIAYSNSIDGLRRWLDLYRPLLRKCNPSLEERLYLQLPEFCELSKYELGLIQDVILPRISDNWANVYPIHYEDHSVQEMRTAARFGRLTPLLQSFPRPAKADLVGPPPRRNRK